MTKVWFGLLYVYFIMIQLWMDQLPGHGRRTDSLNEEKEFSGIGDPVGEWLTKSMHKIKAIFCY